MGRGIRLFKILGIQVSLDYTWFIVFGLVALSLAHGYFPFYYPGLGGFTYFLMGLISSLLLFASVLIHEISHSHTANRLGLEIKEITLFIFGGVARLSREPEDPKVELKIAIAGPASSILLALVFWLLKGWAEFAFPSPFALGILRYLVFINIVLVVFNLIPGFPLDGGRVLRAIWWMRTGDVQRATQVTSQIGKGFSMLLIFLGIFQTLMGNLLGGMWSIIIGMFLQQAAESGYQQLLVKKALGGIKVDAVMTRGVVTVEDSYTLERVVEEYFFGYHFVSFPVMSEGSLVGMLTLNDVRAVPRPQWGTTLVRDVMDVITRDTVLHPGDTALDALSKMVGLGVGRLPVLDDGKLVGIVTRRDIMKLMEFKVDLGV
ncbi:MAG: site-2 protease family protein [Deltaproteobacteria bacterium]|nr:site-2 protease family protein [Deltaproteobacteria bacterium]